MGVECFCLDMRSEERKHGLSLYCQKSKKQVLLYDGILKGVGVWVSRPKMYKVIN